MTIALSLNTFSIIFLLEKGKKLFLQSSCTQLIDIKQEALCFPALENVGNFQSIKRVRNGLTQYVAWAVIRIFYTGFSYDLQVQCGTQLHASFVLTLPLGTEGQIILEKNGKRQDRFPENALHGSPSRIAGY